jgi:hypothetical protein
MHQQCTISKDTQYIIRTVWRESKVLHSYTFERVTKVIDIYYIHRDRQQNLHKSVLLGTMNLISL